MFDSLYVTQKVFFQKVSLSSMNHLKTHTLRDWSKSMGGGGVGRSREGVGHQVLSLVQGVGRAIFSFP